MTLKDVVKRVSSFTRHFGYKYTVKNHRLYSPPRNLVGSTKCIYKGEEYYCSVFSDENIATISKNKFDNSGKVVDLKDIKICK